MHLPLSLAASLFACLIVGHAIPTPEKIAEIPEETKINEPSNLEEKSPPILPTVENDSDDLLRQKKSSTTTFCVEIKPGAAEPCVTVCDPKPDLFIPEYILPPLHVKPPPPPTYLIKEPSCPCGLTPPALITIPHGVSLSSLNLKPIIGRSAESDLAMDYMPMDSSNLMDHIGDTRTFPESLTATSHLNMFAEPSRSDINRGPTYPQGASTSVNLNRGQTHLTTCTSNLVPHLQRDYPMSMGNSQAFQNPIGDRRLYQYKTMDGLQGLTMDPSASMMQSNNMQYQQSWSGPQRYSAGSDPQQQMISNEYGRNSLAQGQLAANQNQAYQLTQQRQMMTPPMYPAPRQMPSPIYGGNGHPSSQQMNQAMYPNDQPAATQQMQRAVYSGDQAASAQQMQRAVYSGDQAASAQQMQRAVYRGDQAAAARQMTPAMYSSSSRQATAQQSSNQQQPVDRGQTNQQIGGSADGNAMMIQQGNQQKSESQQVDMGTGGYQENAESSSKQQVYQSYAGDRQPDRSTATDQKSSSQSEGMSRSERMMRRMKAALAGQNVNDQPFMATAPTQMPQEKQNADCGQQPVQEAKKA